MKSIRQPVGINKSRTLISAKYTRTVAGAPDGEYVVIQYPVSFEKMQSAVETPTPLPDKDGRRRVSGHTIQQWALSIKKVACIPVS